jgi:hypothetical protein
VDPELGFGEGLCMMMAVVMATVRSLQPEKGAALALPFLPLRNFVPLPEVDHGDINLLCRHVEGGKIQLSSCLSKRALPIPVT